MQQLINEVNILSELRHENIVRYYDKIFNKRNTTVYIVMEYCAGRDLGQVIQKCRDTD
jgi:serine/threonine protein kinase